MSLANDKNSFHNMTVDGNCTIAARALRLGFPNVITSHSYNFLGTDEKADRLIFVGETAPGTNYDAVANIGDEYHQVTFSSNIISVFKKFILTAGGWADVVYQGPISIFGSDGAFKASYSTVNLAVAALAAGDILKLKAGEHTLTAACDITEPGWCTISGEPGTTVIGAAGADYCFKTVFGAISSTKGVTFENLRIDHGDDATQVGIDCANASATGRINLMVRNCSFESDGGDSLYTLHASTSASIRWYTSDNDFEGPVEFTVGNTDDRIRFERCDLIGGLVTGTSATAMEIYLAHCKILHEGVTGGNNAQLMYVLYCLSATDTNPEVYAAIDTNDLAGSQNETVMFPTS